MKWSLKEMQPSDMVRVPSGGFYHYGICVDEDTIIQFGESVVNPLVDPNTVEVNATTVDDFLRGRFAEVAEYEGAAFGSYYLNGPGLEPTLIGAIASTTDKGVVSAPVKGLNGVYVFTVESIEDSAAQTAEAERVRAQAVQESMTTQSALQAVQEMAEIKDLRGLYF